MLFQFGFYSSVLLISFTQELFTAFYYLQLLKLTINLIIGWVFFISFVASILHLGCLVLRVVVWQSTLSGYFILHLFSAPLWIVPSSFFYTKFTESLFKFSKKRSTFNARIAISTIHCYFDLWPIHFWRLLYKRNGQRLWAMVSKLGLLSMIVYFILSIRYYNVYKNSCFK
jgi:hypothetical protein